MYVHAVCGVHLISGACLKVEICRSPLPHPPKSLPLMYFLFSNIINISIAIINNYQVATKLK